MKNLYNFITISMVIFYSSLNAQWSQVNFPYSGAVNCLAVGTNGTSFEALFAGTKDDGSVLTNEGTSWQAINNGLEDSVVTSLAIDRSNIYAGTYRDISNIWPFYRGKIFYSTNSGTNWQAADTSFPNGTIKCFAISDSNIFAGVVSMNGGSQIYLSTNTGISWEMVFDTPSAYSVLSNLIINDSNVFAGTASYHSLFLHSFNNGQSFSINDRRISSGIYALARIGNNLFSRDRIWGLSFNQQWFKLESCQ
ncbi:MAG: hypothetical protein U5J96_19660 [Ignavibacteriaceae bacterium]|nr:hypothetical protein [Ignavibacteriaceae bacterium]